MTPDEFEQTVRETARMLWTRAAYGGAEIIGNRERDGIFETDDVVHILEATTSRTKKKAVEDCTKIADLILALNRRNDGRVNKGWFVTEREPTAEQRTAAKEICKKKQIEISVVGYRQFRSRLVNASEYLKLRSSYPFGSVRDPETGDRRDDAAYIKLGMYDQRLDVECKVDDLQEFMRREDAEDAYRSSVVVILGDYGAGKSKTLNYLFEEAARLFQDNRITRFPLFLNLYDHHGQTLPSEALHRHAHNIGFNAPDRLVRGWRAGQAILFLDGFDELAASGWSGQARKLSTHRSRAMQLVRAFVDETPKTAPIFIAGRSHFFDSRDELVRALGVGSSARLLSLSEFTEDQIQEFLSSRGWSQEIPDWLPSRPLLLGYLASRGVLGETRSLGQHLSAPEGWSKLIELICEREARIDPNIDGPAVRTLLERMATKARRDVSGMGPVLQSEMSDVFREVCGYVPDEKGLQLLQRLPGLGVARTTDEAREFIDSDLADTLRAGDVVRFCMNPFDLDFQIEGWNCSADPHGLAVIALQTDRVNLGASEMSIAAKQAVGLGCATLAAEVIAAMAIRGLGFNQGALVVREVVMRDLEFDHQVRGLACVEFQECIFGRLTIDPSASKDALPVFRGCLIEILESILLIAGPKPDSPFVDCEIGTQVQSLETNDRILDLAMPQGTKVLLTILRKLFLQPGAGRQQRAFFRGLDQHAQLLVPDALRIVARHGIARQSQVGRREVWVPNRHLSSRVRRILAAPMATTDPLILESRDLG